MSAGAPSQPLSFAERMAALTRDWRAQVPAKLAAAQDLLAACQAAPGDAGKLEELHRMLHTLAGSAGTFGQEELGTRARTVEAELDRLMDRPARTAADFDGAAQLLQQLLAQPAKD